MTNYYTYIFLDPLKPGQYMYGEYKHIFTHEPFYVGKGKGRRRFDFKTRENHIGHRLSFLRERGEIPIVKRIHKNLSEEDALRFEVKLISLIGRRDKGKGPLTNLSDGGKAGALGKPRKGELHHFFGKSRSETTRKKISNTLEGNIPWNKGRKNHLSEEQIKRMSDGHKGYEMPKNQKDKISKSNKGRPKPVGFVKHLLENVHSVKNWLIMSPSGGILTIKNLTKFCKNKGLSYNALRQTMYTKSKHLGFGVIEKPLFG